MSILRVFTTTNCPRCPLAKKIAKKVADDMNLDLEVINLDEDPVKGLQYQVIAAPSIAIDDETIIFGEVPTEEQLNQEISKYI